MRSGTARKWDELERDVTALARELGAQFDRWRFDGEVSPARAKRKLDALRRLLLGEYRRGRYERSESGEVRNDNDGGSDHG